MASDCSHGNLRGVSLNSHPFDRVKCFPSDKCYISALVWRRSNVVTIHHDNMNSKTECSLVSPKLFRRPPTWIVGATALLLCAGLIIFLYKSRSDKQATSVAARVDGAVVDILAYSTNSGILPNNGTGFFITPTLLVTARHCVAGCEWAEVRYADGQYTPVAYVVSENASADIVLLEVERKSGTHVKLRDRPAGFGEPIFQIGSPMGLMHTLSTGVVSALRKIQVQDSTVNIIQHTAPTFHGNSGCPVFDVAGEVLGMDDFVKVNSNSRKHDEEESVSVSLNFAVGSSEITKLIRAKQVRKPLNSISSIGSGSQEDFQSILTNEDFAIVPRKPENQLQFLKDCVARNANNAYAWFALGEKHRLMNEPGEAITAFQNSIKLKPDYTNAYLTNGLTLLKMNKLDEAKKELLTASRVDSRNPYVWLYLAEVEFKQGDTVNALENCKKVSEAGLTDPDCLKTLANTYFGLRQFQLSLDSFIRADNSIRTTGMAMDVAVVAGILRSNLALSKRVETVREGLEYLKLSPNSVEIAMITAEAFQLWGLNGLANDRKRSELDALLDIGKDLSIRGPKNYGIRLMLGEFYEAAGNFSAAYNAYDQAARTAIPLSEDMYHHTGIFGSATRRKASAKFKLGLISRSENKPNEAKLAFEEALKLIEISRKAVEGPLTTSEVDDALFEKVELLCFLADSDPARVAEALTAFNEVTNTDPTLRDDLLYDLKEKCLNTDYLPKIE